MNRILFLVLAGLCFGQAQASVFTTVCNGCSESGMYQAASRATSSGTVYVFDAIDGDARKFRVSTEVISLRPYQAFTWGDELAIEGDVKNAFRDFADVQRGLGAEERIDLPADFPVRSVAGAMLDPNTTRMLIMDFLRQEQSYEQLSTQLTSLLAALLKRNIPFFNLSDIVKLTKIIVEFADGSSLEYEISYSINALSGAVEIELKIIGNARLSDGSPAPVSGFGFRNFHTTNVGQSVYEWVNWARQNGVLVTDFTGGRGTRMSCSISGSVIHCTVTREQ